ncbi:MAG: carbohydrate porin [Verrucomicrobiota bacterium]
MLSCLVMASGVIHAEREPESVSEEVGSVDGVEDELARRDQLEDSFRSWESPQWLEDFRDVRDEWLDEIGINMTASYHMAGLAVYGGGDPDYGLSGDFTLSGTWEILGDTLERPPNLVFRMRHRHRLGALAASEVANASGGLAWNIIDGFSNSGFEIPDLHLMQEFSRADLEFRYGQMTIDSHFDRHGLRSSKRAFLNRAFSSNPAVAFPRFGAGGILQWKPEGRSFDLTIGASTVQGTQNDEQVDFELGSGDLFSAIQFGRDFELHGRPARAQVLIWHSDSVEDQRTPEGSGISATFEYWMDSTRSRLFTRVAWADGDAADADRLISTGFAVERREADLLGLAFGVGRESGGGDDWQAVIETFYRWQVGPTFQVTPEMQLIFGSGLEPSHPLRLVGGIRFGATF